MLPSRIFFDSFLDDIEAKKFDKIMRCDIYEENGICYIELDVPGFNKEDISIEFEKGYLKVVAEQQEEEKTDKKYVRRERMSITKCERSFYLGEINENEIKAEFMNGILKISVPKEEKQEITKKIINID